MNISVFDVFRNKVINNFVVFGYGVYFDFFCVFDVFGDDYRVFGRYSGGLF